jgi:hypothetical protein
MTYSSASSVAAFTLNILDGNTSFGENTLPTKKQVDNWLSSGCSIIETELQGRGYSIPVSNGISARTRVDHLETLYAVAQAEMARTTATVGPGERTRGQVFETMFWSGLEKFLDGDLTMVGLTRSSTGSIYSGGISIAGKQAYETDSDRVAPRFSRGQFRHAGTMPPDGSTWNENEEGS